MFSERSPADEIDPDSTALAAALAGLVPQHTIDRDRLMFLAGQASVAPLEKNAPRTTAWRVATATALLAASLGGIAIGWQLHRSVLPQVATPAPQQARPADEPSRAFAAARSEPAEPPAVAPAQTSRPSHDSRLSPDVDYLDLRRRVLSFGIDSWSWPNDRRRLEADEEGSYLEMRGKLMHHDTLAPARRRSLDADPPSPAGART